MIEFWNIFFSFEAVHSRLDAWHDLGQDVMRREEFSVKFGHIIRDRLTRSLGFSIQKILS